MGCLKVNIKQQVLIVGDGPHILGQLTVLLEKHNFQITIAQNGEEAWSFMHRYQFDAVFCAHRMPKMEEIPLIRKVRDENNFVPFIFISGCEGEEEALKMASMGAYTLPVKMDLKKIPEIVRKYLQEDEHIKEMIKDGSKDSMEFINLLHSGKL